jgi:hypothetical protein
MLLGRGFSQEDGTMRYIRTTNAVGFTMFLYACGASPRSPAGTPGSTVAVATGAETAACNDGPAWQDALNALAREAVVHVEPTYMRDTCAGSAQVSGTKIAVASSAVQSAPWTRLLACRAARVRFSSFDRSTRGGSSEWAPDGWVEISVVREPKQVVLTLSAASVPENIRLLRRIARRVGPP